MPASQPAYFNLQEFTDAGRLLVGGRLYTYAHGTTAQKTAYTDPDGTVPHTYTPDGAGGQYIALNARGELSAPLYLGNGSYDIALKRADGSTVWTRKADGVENSVRSWLETLTGGLGSSLIGWIRAATGAVATTVGKWIDRQEMCVFDFMTDAQIADVRARTLSVDVTPAIKKAIAAATAASEPLRFPRGWYLITDTLMLPQGATLRGANWFPSDWRVPGMASTKLKLVAGAVKDLLAVDQASLNQGYVWGINVSNMTLEGSDVVGSRGLFLQRVASSVFENIGISRFWRGVEVEFGMLNTFNRVNSSKCLEASFYQNGKDVTTTQVYNDCVARESPWGWISESTPTGNSFGTVWNNCGLESLTQGGISVHRCCGFEWRGGYSENVPDDRVTKTGAIFHLWLDGDAGVDTYRSVGVIDGGDLGGGNFNSYTDSAIIEVGSAKSLVINGSSMKRANKGIRWDASTADGAIQFGAPPNFVQIANLYSGPDGKMQGVYPEGILTTGATRLLARFWSMFLAGGQLRFPAAQNPSDDPNTLDDYEEGTWTGALTPATGTITQSFKTGYYTKIGRLVNVTGLFVPTAVAAPAGILKLTGLPYKAKAGGGGEVAAGVSVRYMTGVATAMSVDAIIQAGTDYIEIAGFNNGNPVNLSPNIQAGTEVRINVTYTTD